MTVKPPRNLHPTAVAVYAALLPGLREVAREHGYALALHGSMTSDLDLIAVPWVDGAHGAEILIEAMRAHVGGSISPRSPMVCPKCAEQALTECKHCDKNPSKRSHGRLAWAIHLAGTSGPYLDVSVMPLRPWLPGELDFE